jgi:hypothetical protein
MSNALAKGKLPKNPDENVVLTKCWDDFRKFKGSNGTIILEHLSTLITDLEERGLDSDVYKKQKEHLEEIKSLIKRGEEKVAFTRFTRAFPYCLPHRSIL